jgi:hypothetical protein
MAYESPLTMLLVVQTAPSNDSNEATTQRVNIGVLQGN